MTNKTLAISGIILRILNINWCSRLFVLGALLLSISFLNIKAEAAPFETSSKSSILIDVESNSVLFQKNADELAPPASMSKMMTAAVVFKALKEGKIKLETEFRVSENAWRYGGAPSGTAAMFASLNSNVSVHDLLQGMIVQSGNDACMILAEGLAGGEEGFAKQMTEYARKIGLTKSQFKNSTGLPDDGHKMTTRELALLALHIIKTYPEYYAYFGQRDFNYKEKYRFTNRHPLVFQKTDVDGLVAGYSEDYGYGLVSSAIRDGRRLLSVVTGLEEQKDRETETRKLLDWGFGNFKVFTLFKKEEIIGDARVWGAQKTYVKLNGGKDDVRMYLPRSGLAKLRGSIIYKGPLKPPIKAGDKIAVLRVTGENDISKDTPLYAAEDVEPSGFMWRGLDSFVFLAFGWLYHSL